MKDESVKTWRFDREQSAGHIHRITVGRVRLDVGDGGIFRSRVLRVGAEYNVRFFRWVCA